jgi:hypothetical protein
MRLYEFADAESQLGLLRIIIDNTWSAIAQQAEQERRAEAERKAQAKLKPRAKKSSKFTSIRIPTPPPPLAKKPQTALANQPPSPLNKPNPNDLNAFNPNSSTNSQLKQQPTNTAINPKLSSVPQPTPATSNPLKPQTGLKTLYLDKNIDAVQNDVRGTDRHSKNGIATLKKLPRNFQHPST